ncbi:MAG: ZIP family metal transporter [candidate division WOR-3 bacterium]|nr:ZIP family metal transporter [candidate division WOR-3 bacterium]
MQVWLYSIISVVIVSLVSIIGILTLAMNKERLKRVLLFLVSFAVGGLFGDAFIHLLPESFEHFGTRLQLPLLVISGIMIFFVLEKFLRWRHCHILTSDEHLHPIVTMNVVGDAIHNLLDGMIIGASYAVSIPIGITTTLAVVLHEIPQEIGDFGILIHGGLTPQKAVLYNFLSALVAVIGVLLSLIIGPHIKNYSIVLIPITAGGFIYIAGSDLIPELQHDVKISISLLQFIFILLGIAVMALLGMIE